MKLEINQRVKFVKVGNHKSIKIKLPNRDVKSSNNCMDNLLPLKHIKVYFVMLWYLLLSR